MLLGLKEKALTLNGETILIIRKKRRKTISLSIEPEGIIIKTPYYVPQRELKEFALKHWSWIEKKLKTKKAPLTFETGSKFYFLGETLSLNLLTGSRLMFVDGKTFTIRLPEPSPEKVKKIIQTFYINEAKARFPQLLEELSTKISLTPKALTLKSFKARWGSCSQTGVISLNWKLMIAPLNTIKYVMIHELCHLQEFNHSKAFWALVEQHCPNFKEHKEWLNQHAHFLRDL